LNSNILNIIKEIRKPLQNMIGSN